MAGQSTEIAAGERQQKAPAKWWCNFCGFATNDQNEYLKHSCAEILAKEGRTPQPTGGNECR